MKVAKSNVSRSHNMSKVVKYVRKPKSERQPPVFSIQTDYMTYEEAMLDVALSNRMVPSALQGYAYNNFDGNLGKGIAHRTICEKMAIHVSERAVTLTMSRQIVRWNQKVEKPYSTWETLAVRSIFRSSNGKINFYFYNIDIDPNTGQKNRFTISPYDEVGSTNFPVSARFYKDNADHATINPMATLRAHAEHHFGESISLEALYPMRERVTPRGHRLLTAVAMRANNAQEFTEAVFGKQLYRKDLVRAVASYVWAREGTWSVYKRQEVAPRLYWLQMFKGLVPADWIVESLNNSEATWPKEQEYTEVKPLEREIVKWFRELLMDLKPAERRNIMNNAGVHLNTIRDLKQRTYPEIRTYIPEKRDNFKSLEDLHDRVFRTKREIDRIEARKRDAERYKPENMWINKDPIAKQMAFTLEHMLKAPYAGWRVEIARDNGALFSWSDEMQNCISSYFGSQNTLLGAFYDQSGNVAANFELRQRTDYPLTGTLYQNGQPVTIEIEQFTLNQLLGKHNASLDPMVRDTLMEFFKAAGISRGERIWW